MKNAHSKERRSEWSDADDDQEGTSESEMEPEDESDGGKPSGSSLQNLESEAVNVDAPPPLALSEVVGEEGGSVLPVLDLIDECQDDETPDKDIPPPPVAPPRGRCGQPCDWCMQRPCVLRSQHPGCNLHSAIAFVLQPNAV